ncbi:MAG: hypothetical protein ACK526_19865 [Planctomyces sp.]|jgi:hypothetical protein
MEKGIEGLKAIGAVKAASAFQKALRDTKKIEPHVLDRFLKSMTYTRTAAFRSLSEHDAAIEKAFAKEDVLELHAEWLKTRPGLQVLDDAEVDAQIALRMNAIPDRAARLAEVDKEGE